MVMVMVTVAPMTQDLFELTGRLITIAPILQNDISTADNVHDQEYDNGK